MGYPKYYFAASSHSVETPISARGVGWAILTEIGTLGSCVYQGKVCDVDPLRTRSAIYEKRNNSGLDKANNRWMIFDIIKMVQWFALLAMGIRLLVVLEKAIS